MDYFAEAKTGVLAGRTDGALVAGVVSFLKSPGRKNDAGETEVLAFTPPQPPARKGRGSNSIASHKNFQFNLTWLL
jgi:hypothetical protein